MGIHKNPVRIGIVGTGFGALVQLPGLLAMDGATVIGIASKDAEKAKTLSAVHNLPRTFATWQELVACDEIDLVSVTTPPFMHEEIVSAAIKAGKHVLCEKPFTMNAAGAKKLLEQAEAAGIVHGIDFEFRDLTVLQALKQELQHGTDWIERATLSWRVGTWADATRSWRWQCDHVQGGGVLGALGVHLFDAAQWLLGPLQQKSADVQTKITERPDGNGGMRAVTAEDYASVDMTSDDGYPVNVTVTNVEATGNGLSIIIEGKNRSLRLLSAEQDYGRGLRLESVEGNGKPVILATETEPPAGTDARIPPFQRFATRLLKAVQEGDTSFRPSFRDGLNAQILRDRALESLDIADRAS